MGVTAGGMPAQIYGITEVCILARAFIFIGAPGILIGLLVLFTVKELYAGIQTLRYEETGKAVSAKP